MKRILISVIMILMITSATLAQDHEGIVVKNAVSELRFHAQTGRIDSFKVHGEEVGRSESSSQWFDFLLNGQWQYGRQSLVVRSVQREGNGVVVKTGFGAWDFDFIYALDPQEPLLSCKVAIQWNGDDEMKLKSFWYDLPEFSIEANSTFFIPGQYPPQQHKASDLSEGETKSAWNPTPSIIIEQKPTRSILLIADDATPVSDSCSIKISRRGDKFRPCFVFSIQARMKKGARQELGTMYMRVLDTNGEAALRSIHDWMKKVGHVIPKDRPEWFKSATLYSFHPGGTIGSNCKDLGGFLNAMPLMKRIRSMNMNSLWIMPIEDLSIYWPRDYYKFQEGLGDGNAYHKLVDYSHELGFHVLQDCVPHGGSDKYPRALEHPDWLVYDEEGKTFHYWCFDFNHPEWRQYMRDVAKYYVSEYHIDGYRVDAVAGSKTANWSAKIPYERASFALRQGGLNMLRSIRSGVKEAKPRETGLLAETGGSCYGIVSDAIYDFSGCYHIHHDLYRQKPDVFVRNVRRWLHEQQYAEVADLLRLRHAESHDSLRSALTFGIEPARAIVAFTALIHGIPLIYQEQENGHFDVFAQLFDIRNRLPEFQGGMADYINVPAPDGVFAVRRSLDKNESIAFINFNETPVSFSLDVANVPVVTDMFLNKRIETSGKSIPITIDPYRYTVIALRDIPNLPKPMEKPSYPAVKNIALPDTIEIGDSACRVLIDKQTGLPRAIEGKGGTVQWNAALQLPPGFESESKAEITLTPEQHPTSIKIERRFKESVLTLIYKTAKEGIQLESFWSGSHIPKDASLRLGTNEGIRWNVMTAEGYLADARLVRNANTHSGTGSIYQRLQGTEVLYDSLLYPLNPGPEQRSWLGCRTQTGAACSLIFGELPARVQWLGRDSHSDSLTTALFWSSSDWIRPVSPQWSVTFVPYEKEPTYQYPAQSELISTKSRNLVPVAGGWLFENAHIRLYINRNGSLRSLFSKSGKEYVPVLGLGDIYTDYGFGGDKDKTRYSSNNDVEAACRIVSDTQGTRLRFEGSLRGFGRFELLRNRVPYSIEYLLNDSSAFEISCRINAGTKPEDVKTFLALRYLTDDSDEWLFLKDGKRINGGKLVDKAGRVGQTRGQMVPDCIELFRQGKKTVSFHSIAGKLPVNLFMDAHQLFFAVCDNDSPSPTLNCDWKMTCTVHP